MAKSQDKMAEDSKRQRDQRGPDRKAEILDKKIKLGFTFFQDWKKVSH